MSYCPHCGHEATGDQSYCSQCGKPVAGQDAKDSVRSDNIVPRATYGPTGSPPDNHLAKAILATLLCCLPLGIVAIVHAASVNGKFIAGDATGAQRAADQANNWGNWSIGLGLAGGILYGLIMLVGALAGA